MTKDFEIIFLPEVAQMTRESESNVRVKVKKARKGIYDYPLPISGHRERLAFLKSEIESYLLRKNEAANRAPPQGSQQLSPEVLMRAAQLGLMDDCNTKQRNKKGEQK